MLMVPATNNGNDNTNGRFNNDFGVHPNFWNFLWGVKDVMSKADTDIRQLLYSSITPSTSPLYNNLKVKREQLKANLKAELISLEDYLAAVAAIPCTLEEGRWRMRVMFLRWSQEDSAKDD